MECIPGRMQSRAGVCHSVTRPASAWDIANWLARRERCKISTKPALKDPKDFRLIGTSVRACGWSGYRHWKGDLRIGCTAAGDALCNSGAKPVPGGKLQTYEAAGAEAVPGVRAVVKIGKEGQAGEGVAVVAENTWAAIQGRAALKVSWDNGSIPEFSSESIRQKLVDTTRACIAKEAAYYAEDDRSRVRDAVPGACAHGTAQLRRGHARGPLRYLGAHAEPAGCADVRARMPSGCQRTCMSHCWEGDSGASSRWTIR